MKRARRILTTIWIAFFAVDVAIILLLNAMGWIHADNFAKALSLFNSLYVPYVGLILSFHFGEASGRSPRTKELTLAISTSLLWNVAVGALLLRLLAGSGTIEESLEQIQTVGGTLSWLVAPALGYYFRQATNNAANRPS